MFTNYLSDTLHVKTALAPKSEPLIIIRVKIHLCESGRGYCLTLVIEIVDNIFKTCSVYFKQIYK